MGRFKNRDSEVENEDASMNGHYVVCTWGG